VDLGVQFCERCGRDSDGFASAHISLHTCPGCGVTCCSDCWNLVDAACLKCAPFRLVEPPRRAGTTLPAALTPGGAALPAWHADGPRAARPPEDPPRVTKRPSPPTARLAPEQREGLDPAPVVRASPVAPSSPAEDPRAVSSRARPGRRAGRIGIAAAGAWVIVAAMAVAAFGAFPGRPGATGEGSAAASPAANAPASDGSGLAVPSATPAQGGSPERATPGQIRTGSSASPVLPSRVPVGGGISSRTPGSLAGTPVGPPSGTMPSVTPPPGPVWVPPPTEDPTPTPTSTEPQTSPTGGG
jgi:hypothetical protein